MTEETIRMAERGERRIARIQTGKIADEFVRLRNQLALTHAELQRQLRVNEAHENHIDSLIKENLQLLAAMDRKRELA